MEGEIRYLRKLLDKSNYTVALCGSGMMEECGFLSLKKDERAFDIETRYGASPEEIFSSAYYNTRINRFFDFYKKEILANIPSPGSSSYALAAMERAGSLQAIITANIFEQEQRGGCEKVTNLHGSIYDNRCPHCGERYTVEDMIAAKKIPYCRECNTVIRPMVSLFGEMVDSRIMTRTTEEIERAEVLLLLGSTFKSEVFSHYFRYFQGNALVIIHSKEHYLDNKADLVLIGEPHEILEQLGY